MKHCPSCGHENPEQAKFCIRCGKPLAEPAENAAPASAPTSQPKPSPYAALPHIPSSAKGPYEDRDRFQNEPESEGRPVFLRFLIGLGALFLAALLKKLLWNSFL